MTARERVTAVLQGQIPDRVPVYPILSGVTRNLVGAGYKEWSTDADICTAAYKKAVEELELDCVVTLIDLSVECAGWGPKLIYPENEAIHPDYTQPVIGDLDEYGKIKKMDYRDNPRMMMHLEVCRRLVAEIGRDVPIVAFVFGPLGTLSMLRGQQDMFMDIYDDPDAVYGAAREINETLKDYVDALIDVGVDGVMFDTLYASGSIMSKEMWDELEGPLIEELADVVHRRERLVMLHNCGQRIYFDVQIKRMKPCAISFLHVPDDCESYRDCRERYPDTVLIGCVPPPLVVTGTDEEWDEACRQNFRDMGQNGGFMLATGCEFPANASLDKAYRMVNIAKTECRYPVQVQA